MCLVLVSVMQEEQGGEEERTATENEDVEAEAEAASRSNREKVSGAKNVKAHRMYNTLTFTHVLLLTTFPFTIVCVVDEGTEWCYFYPRRRKFSLRRRNFNVTTVRDSFERKL